MSDVATIEETARGQVDRFWLPDIVHRIGSFLSDNEIACTFRLVNKAAAVRFSQFKQIKLSRPCPEYAFAARWGVTGTLHFLSFEKRRDLLTLTASSGSIPNLKVALQAIAATLTDEPLQPDSVAPGQLCPWLRDRGCCWLVEVFIAAARAGQRAMCDWLLACGCNCAGSLGVEAVYAAVRGGLLSLREWMLQQQPDLHGKVHPPKLLEAAAEGCALEDLRRLLDEWGQGQGGQGRELSAGNMKYILTAAIGSPTPDWQAKVEWLEALGYPRISVNAGALTGMRHEAVSRLVWLRSRGYPLDTGTVLRAAEDGNTAVLEYLLGEVGVQLDTQDIDDCACAAAEYGHLGFLQAMHARGYVSRRDALEAYSLALRKGHLAVAEWLVDTFQVPLASLREGLLEGVSSGSLEVVQWLLGRGCRLYGLDVVSAAVDAGCVELLKLLLVEKEQPCWEQSALYRQAARHGDLVTLRCLRAQLQPRWSPTTTVLENWINSWFPLVSLRWLVEEVGCPADWQQALRAVEARAVHYRDGTHDIKQWLLTKQQQQPGPQQPSQQEQPRRRRLRRRGKKQGKRQGKRQGKKRGKKR